MRIPRLYKGVGERECVQTCARWGRGEMKRIGGWLFFVLGLVGTVFFGLAVLGDIRLKIDHMLGKDVGESLMAMFFWPMHVAGTILFLVFLVVGRKMLKNGK